MREGRSRRLARVTCRLATYVELLLEMPWGCHPVNALVGTAGPVTRPKAFSCLARAPNIEQEAWLHRVHFNAVGGSSPVTRGLRTKTQSWSSSNPTFTVVQAKVGLKDCFQNRLSTPPPLADDDRVHGVLPFVAIHEGVSGGDDVS